MHKQRHLMVAAPFLNDMQRLAVEHIDRHHTPHPGVAGPDKISVPENKREGKRNSARGLPEGKSLEIFRKLAAGY